MLTMAHLQTLAQMRAHCQSAKWVHSAQLRQLLFGMLCEKPQERFSIHQVLDHPWLRDGEAGSSSNHGSASSAAHAASPSTQVFVRHQNPPHSDRAAAQHLSQQRSLTKAKAHSTSSASAASPFPSDSSSGGGVVHALQINAVVPRPLSAESESAPPSSYGSQRAASMPGAAAASPSPPCTPSSSSRARAPVVKVKVSLPSLSPEKPCGNRSPEKTFAKRSNSVTTPHAE